MVRMDQYWQCIRIKEKKVMKKIKFIPVLVLVSFLSFGISSCKSEENSTPKSDDINIVEKDNDTHFLRFMENNAEIMRLVVLEKETYSDLQPYFPTLTQEDGWIKYWDGDYTYTDYSVDNQFKVYDSSNLIIDIYSYTKKI